MLWIDGGGGGGLRGRWLSFGSQSSWKGKLLLEPEPGWWTIYQPVIAMIHAAQRGAIILPPALSRYPAGGEDDDSYMLHGHMSRHIQ